MTSEKGGESLALAISPSVSANSPCSLPRPAIGCDSLLDREIAVTLPQACFSPTHLLFGRDQCGLLP